MAEAAVTSEVDENAADVYVFIEASVDVDMDVDVAGTLVADGVANAMLDDDVEMEELSVAT